MDYLNIHGDLNHIQLRQVQLRIKENQYITKNLNITNS